MTWDTVNVVYAVVQACMYLCELRAVHEHERQPIAHITTWGLSSVRVSNAETPGFDVFEDHGNMGKKT